MGGKKQGKYEKPRNPNKTSGGSFTDSVQGLGSPKSKRQTRKTHHDSLFGGGGNNTGKKSRQRKGFGF